MHSALVIALSAFLLFLLEPIVAKEILPWFGGAAAVWTTCLVFFQSALLAGYAYSDWVTHRLSSRQQAIVHAVLLAASVAVLPIIPGAAWRPSGNEDPVLRILGLLLTTIGPPFVMLSTTGPLVQAWVARMRERDPYQLFALSNAASLAALIGYPVLFEPWLTTRLQAQVWSVGYALFVLLCAWLAWKAAAVPVVRTATSGDDAAAAPSASRRLLWLALAATGSVLLLAVTNHMTQDIAAVPMLWLLPLTLYLLSFILCFDARGWYRPRLFFFLLLATIGVLAWLLWDSKYRYQLYVQVGAFSAGMFVLCMFCHGELARLKPPPRYLTGFYLMVAAGGALGALLVGVVAPLVLPGYFEMGLSLVACALLAAIVSLRENRLRAALASVAIAGAAWATYANAADEAANTVLRVRNFYGVLRVKDMLASNGQTEVRRLIHGTILHGEQWLGPDQRREPTTYYTETSGVGIALKAKQEAGPLRVGVIGLGAGTLAAYGREGDTFRFYDINPAVIEIAKRDFTFISDTKAKVEIELGDARLSMEREPLQKFDLLAVDAFSGDAIPIHLLTREALALYLRHMKPDGIIALHVSNRYLDLALVADDLAAERGLALTMVNEKATEDPDKRVSDWILLAADPKVLEDPDIAAAAADIKKNRQHGRVWTDDFNNLLQVLY
jgi:SAM-dependent methyltransferase